MSEICRNCPIKSCDPEAVVLGAVAAEVANMKNLLKGEDVSISKVIDAIEEWDFELSEVAAELSPASFEKARICGQKILWNECEFARLEQSS